MSAHGPIVSVILPVYNAARWLRVALDSLSAQTFTEHEIIAVNDGSTDDTLAILQGHAMRDPRLRIHSRDNTGIVGALNDGLALARGPFVARMDGDDEAAPQRFLLQLERFRDDPSLVGLGSAVTFMDAHGHSVQSCPRPQTHTEIERALLGGDGGALIHPSTMFRSAALSSLGGYRRVAQYLEDLDLYLRLAQIGTLANLGTPLLRYRVHPASINFTRNTGRQALKLTVLREAHAARGLPFDPEAVHASEVYSDPAAHARTWAVTALAFGSRRIAIGHGFRAIRFHPRSPASWRALRYALTAPLTDQGTLD